MRSAGNGTGDKAARRRLLAADHDECSRELGRVAGLHHRLGQRAGEFDHAVHDAGVERCALLGRLPYSVTHY